MTVAPWPCAICHRCGRQVLRATTEDGRTVDLNPHPMRLFRRADGGRAVLDDCYQAHAVTCAYRG